MIKHFFLVLATALASVAAQAADILFEKAIVLSEVQFLPSKTGPFPIVAQFEHRGNQCHASLSVTWTFRSELKTRASAKVEDIVCGDAQMKAKAFVAANDGVVGLDLGCMKPLTLGCEMAVLKEGASFKLGLIQ